MSVAQEQQPNVVPMATSGVRVKDETDRDAESLLLKAELAALQLELLAFRVNRIEKRRQFFQDIVQES